jgi:hypothetical protein
VSASYHEGTRGCIHSSLKSSSLRPFDRCWLECPKSGRRAGSELDGFDGRQRTEECEAIAGRGVGHQMPQLAQLQYRSQSRTPQKSDDRQRNRNGDETDDVFTGWLEMGR